jgi:hypothetical protein
MNKSIAIGCGFCVLIILAIYFSKIIPREGYSNNTLEDSMGDYPGATTNALVQDIYPITGRNGITNNQASDIWWHYPTFKLGSYAQITNNLKYSDNPDIGNCMPASMCGSLYKEKHLKGNYIHPLPPVNNNCGTRIGYFSTSANLLPIKNDVTNVLY